jgi:hypothetical protein
MMRYGPEAMQFAHSPSVQALKMHEMGIWEHSKELHDIISSVFTLYHEVTLGGIEAGWSMNEDGSYDEWISNESARHVFKELYHLAKDVRAFIESPMVRNHKRLERLTMKDPHFQKMFQMLQDDLNVHTWEEFGQRLDKIATKVTTEL